ncbi:ATP-binding protein [Phenylobacterium sp. Root77]|uniref:helicase HerA-like domain-containing protein n=1 Tax=unclassified Phenylobacterium TaxID=2640670 RepID=UPI0006FAF1E2|nr:MULTISPECIES: helicase HerA-like domain-containing protein [unclassified Phenylobacterium]KQW69204.1 ATP-binding protein [Phenylobacterium sp. Root1277]KQW95429.1 ATP-binding protein [Phenylobacterium sp. Root1290]KRC41219.1 ATP-binding protein [Phenylobacterium sp. Root77]
MSDGVLIGFSDHLENLLLNRANRHGLVAGATGTGKTVTLQVLAQGLSDAGVPVFAADVKGDLCGVAQPGTPNPKFEERAKLMGLTLNPQAAPTVFWDLFGQQGHPIRATVSEMGPLLISRMLDLNDVQEGVLTVVFRAADDEGLLLLDLKDLQAALSFASENAKELGAKYGNVSPATVATIQRKLLVLEDQGGAGFFGEPALQLSDIMRTDGSGRGFVNILAADKLIASPRLYATFLLWLMSELFEELPEVGDPDKPRLAFFFDEAHLLFRDAPKPLLEKVEQVVRLIRSKGVGVYFVTQNPADIPETVLGQLGNRIQHALRAYTPTEQKGLKAASNSFRTNPAFDTAEAIQALGVGEALVSVLDEKGAPTVVQRTLIRPPVSRLGPITPAERAAIMAQSPVRGLYDTAKDRESAFEILKSRAAAATEAAQAPAAGSPWGGEAQAPAPRGRAPAAAKPRASNRQSMGEAFTKSLLRQAGSTIARELMRGILGGMKKR